MLRKERDPSGFGNHLELVGNGLCNFSLCRAACTILTCLLAVFISLKGSPEWHTEVFLMPELYIMDSSPLPWPRCDLQCELYVLNVKSGLSINFFEMNGLNSIPDVMLIGSVIH